MGFLAHDLKTWDKGADQGCHQDCQHSECPHLAGFRSDQHAARLGAVCPGTVGWPAESTI